MEKLESCWCLKKQLKLSVTQNIVWCTVLLPVSEYFDRYLSWKMLAQMCAHSKVCVLKTHCMVDMQIYHGKNILGEFLQLTKRQIYLTNGKSNSS